MATKFMRALPYATGSNSSSNDNALILKFMYEFWGYCVNGTSALTTPGGFPSVNFVGGGLPTSFTETNPSTTIASASTTNNSAVTFPQSSGNIVVGSTTNFPSSGYLLINGTQLVSYSATNSVTFEGVIGGTPSTTSSGSQTLPTVNFNVASTTGFPTTGQFTVSSQTVTYTGISGNTFTGCSGGTGTITNGNTVNASVPASSTITPILELPQATMIVASTAGFPGVGSVSVSATNSTETISYTGITATTFTGCTGGTTASTTTTGSQTLPVGTINVASTNGFPSTGQILVQTSVSGTYQLVSYTGTTSTSFTGCTQLAGSGTSSNGSSVTLVNISGGTAVNSQVYMATGTDGSTITGSGVFTALTTTPFTQNMVGKYLVMWVPNSGLSDDSIYQITAVINSSSILVNPNNGGSPSPSTLHPVFTNRTGINYRVVDIVAASQASGVVPGNYMVFQFNSSAINTGQANSQCQIIMRQQQSPFSGSTMQNFGLVGSPSGSWTGSAFTGTPTTTTITGQNFPLSNATLNVVSTQGFPGSGSLLVGSTTVTYTGFTGTTFTGCNSSGSGAIGVSTVTVVSYNDTMAEQNATTNSGGFFSGNGANNNGYLTMIADSDFILIHVKATNSGGLTSANSGGVIHIETPYRLYPQGNDPNPFTVMIDGLNGISTQGNNGGTFDNYAGGFALVGTDFTTRKHNVMVKSLSSDGLITNGLVGGNVPGTNLSNATLGFNVFNGTAVSSEVILSTFATATQFCLARCKLKNVRIAGTYIPSYHKIGNSGQYLHLISGVCWPWDNTILPYNLMPGGF